MCLLGEPTEGKVVLGHFGSLWLRIRVQGNFIHTAFSDGKRDQNSILRMHEVISPIVPHLNDDEFERFTRYFKPIFVDDYATVPHESIKRMLALHHAGKLSVIALGADHRIDAHRAESGAVVHFNGQSDHFPVFVDATGQRALGSKDFPFPSLRRQGIVQDEVAAGSGGPARGIAIDDQFHLVSDDVPFDQLFCLSMPFLMGRHPFVQGITSSYEMGAIVGEQLASAIDRETTGSASVLERVGA